MEGDYKCATPVGAVPIDAAADRLFVLPQNQIVYFEIQDPAGALVLFAPWQPVVATDLVLWAPGGVVPPGLGSAAMTERRETMDLVEHGAVVVWVADCVGGLADFRGTPSPRTTITTSTGSAPYYFVDPTRTGGGYAWFINVPPDSTSVEVRLDGKPQQSARVPVRAGATTAVHFNYPQFL